MPITAFRTGAKTAADKLSKRTKQLSRKKKKVKRNLAKRLRATRRDMKNIPGYVPGIYENPRSKGPRGLKAHQTYKKALRLDDKYHELSMQQHKTRANTRAMRRRTRRSKR